MKFHNVDEIITQGTFHGEVLKSSMIKSPDRLVTIVKFQNQEIENQMVKWETKLKNLVVECPWLTYWWTHTPLPIGHQWGRNPISNQIFVFQSVHEAELRATII
jgi:hypothetical protein